MDAKPRMTKQGLKDLNHYGPKPPRASAEGAPAPEGGDQVKASDEVKASPPVVEKTPDAPVSVGA
jgi:hypothetical protein